MGNRMSPWIITLVCAFTLAAQTAAFAPAVRDDCNLPFRGSYHKAVKNRPPKYFQRGVASGTTAASCSTR
jgi:hypothetical protein